MINLHESMGPDRDRTSDTWICDQTRQASKYLKIGTCPASLKILAYMGKNLIFTRNIKIFTCPAALGTRKYERTSAIFEPCTLLTVLHGPVHLDGVPEIIFGKS